MSGAEQKITTHSKKREKYIHNEEEIQSIKADPETRNSRQRH